ncbi:MAG: beta-propeller domain-containing protein [Lachnospiraceae bacterium]
MKDHKNIVKQLKNEAEQLEIPESIQPDNIRKKLEARQMSFPEKQENAFRKGYRKILASAACLCIISLTALTGWYYGYNRAETVPDESKQTVILQEETAEFSGISYPKATYEDIYESMNKIWKTRIYRSNDAIAANEISDMTFKAEAEKQMNSLEESAADTAYGTTNVQTAGVDEGDIMKNDGRYLYHVIYSGEESRMTQAIQIIDTADGLEKLTVVDGFENISEFYVWEDTLIVIENKYLYNGTSITEARKAFCDDSLYHDRCFHEITFYDLADRRNPEKIKSFTLDGIYTSSRIADGYFYGFSRYDAYPGGGKEDYKAYVPTLDGSLIREEDIFLPETGEATSYLVFVGINLENPTEFSDTTAIVSSGEMYYVSADHIYVSDLQPMEPKEGWSCDKTRLLKFSYGEGTFSLQAEGEINGRLDDSFSMDEYEGSLRCVTTVRQNLNKKITDDRTGESIGYETAEVRQSNALYIFDGNLQVTGKIEGLAENEQIYSARFLGDTGYFVTFRQTDPLFAVDLSDPENPRILSKLKVSGFSDYLHFYGTDRLLGIGMEADEETGRQKCMKLSMFDISDTSDVQEIGRLNLEAYDYSEALYNHKAVMISTEANLFGFEAEGYQSGHYQKDYFVFSYENDSFVLKLKLNTNDSYGAYHTTRGTFIGTTFYLLGRDGSVKSYDLNTGNEIDRLP